MRYRKKVIAFVVMLLVLGVCANSVLPEACLCGQACLHGLQAKAKINVKLLFHLRCSGTLCMSCDLEKGQTLKATSSATLTPNMKIFNNSILPASLLKSPSIFPILKDFDFFNGYGAAPSSPIYIQKTSLLC